MQHRRLLLLGTCALLVWLTALPAAAATRAYVHDRVADQLHQQGEARVIVSMWDPKLPQARAADWRQRLPAIEDMARRVRAAAPRFRVRWTYEVLPYLAGTVDRAALDQLAACPLVEMVYPDRVLKAALSESGKLIGQPQAEAAEFDGRGVSIAILDTGIDYKHPTFGGNASTTFPSRKVVGGYDLVNKDADPMDDNGHGTHVAGIAAGTDSLYRGIAPAAALVAYKVLNANGLGFGSDVLAALERVIQDRARYNIKVVNLSMSDESEWTDPEDCDSFPDAAIYADLTAQGILVVAAAGNEGYRDGIGFPACVSEVLSTGATLDGGLGATPADGIASFTNRGELLGIFAPGQWITSANATSKGGGFATASGTSMAAPHVAGAAACVVNMISPDDPAAMVSPGEIRSRLRARGIQIIDPVTRVAVPRVDLARAMTASANGRDLTVTSVTTPVTMGFPGDPIVVNLCITNQGDAPSPPCTALVVLSANKVISPQDAAAATVYLPALNPSDCYTDTALVATIPAVAAGAYVLGAFVDSSYGVPEADETNNALAGVSLTVGTSARVEADTIPGFLLTGQTYPVSLTMVNEGPVAWTAAGGYELVAVSPLATNRWGIARAPLPPEAVVSPGQSVTFTFGLTAPLAPGWHPCHWQMARRDDVFGEVASGATKALIADDAILGQDFPAVSGDRVAYEDYRGRYGAQGVPAISVTNLATGGTRMLPQDIPLPTGSSGNLLPPYEWLDVAYQKSPAISGPWVVWMADDVHDPALPDPKNTIWYYQVLAYNVATPRVMPRRIAYNPANPWDAWFPAIDGNVVVWEDYRNDPDRVGGSYLTDNSDIYIADLTDPVGPNNTLPTYPVCTAPGPQLWPRVSGRFVVWEDWRDLAQADIWAYDLSVDSDGDGVPNWKEPVGLRPSPDPAEIRLTHTSSYEMTPDVWGDTIVWLDLRRDDGSLTKVDIYRLDVDTATVSPVATDPLTTRYQARVDGGKVVWTDMRSGAPDVYWKDLDTGTEIPIAASSESQDLPDISGRRIVYAQSRSPDVSNVWAQRMLTNGSVGVHTFTDVTTEYWAFDWIEAVSSHGVTAGFPDGSYGPAVQLTRDQMTVFIARALAGGDASVPTGPVEPTFSDVPPDHWAYPYIEYCADPAQGVVQGFPDGTFQPALNLSRAAMAVFVARAIAGGDDRVPMGPPTPSFPDVLPTGPWEWAYRYVEYLKSSGVVGGYPDGTYRPEDGITRDQAAVYIGRAFHYLPG